MDLTEQQLKALEFFEDTKFMRPEAFDSVEEFDSLCQAAYKLYRHGLLESLNGEPFRKNYQADVPVFNIAGPLTLSIDGEQLLTSHRVGKTAGILASQSHWGTAIKNLLSKVSHVTMFVAALVTILGFVLAQFF